MNLDPVNIIIMLIITFILIEMFNKDIFESIMKGRSTDICMKESCEGFEAPVEFLVSESDYSNLYPLGKSAPGSYFTTENITKCPSDGLGYHAQTGNKGCSLTSKIDAMTGLTKDTNSTATGYRIWPDEINASGVKLNTPDFLPSDYKWSFVKDNVVKDKCPNNQFIHGFNSWNKVYCSPAVIKDSNNIVIAKLEDDGSKKNSMNGGLFHNKAYDQRMRTCPKKNQFLTGLIGSTSNSGRYWTPTAECTTFKVTGTAKDYYDKAKAAIGRCKPDDDDKLPTTCTYADKKFLEEGCSGQSKEVPGEVQYHLFGLGDSPAFVKGAGAVCTNLGLQDRCDARKIPKEECSEGAILLLREDCEVLDIDPESEVKCTHKAIKDNEAACKKQGIDNKVCTREERLEVIAAKNTELQEDTLKKVTEAAKDREASAAARAAKNEALQRELAEKLLGEEGGSGDAASTVGLTMNQKGFGALIAFLMIGLLIYLVTKKDTPQYAPQPQYGQRGGIPKASPGF